MSRPRIVLPDTSEDTLALIEKTGDLGRLREFGEVETYLGRAPDNAAFAERVREADGVMLGWYFPTAAFAEAKRLKTISFCGVGASSFVDLETAKRHGVEVLTAPGYGDVSVAEHALTLLLALLHRVPETEASLRAGRFDVQGNGRNLSGRRVGLLGWGGIAKAFARLLEGFDCEVRAWTPSRAVGSREGQVTFLDLDTLLAESEILSLHLAYTPETENILSAERLAALPPGAVLVNTARGGLLDETALAERLASGALSGAALDVFRVEPLPADSPLREAPNLILTPHVAFRTLEARRTLYSRVVDNLIAALRR